MYAVLLVIMLLVGVLVPQLGLHQSITNFQSATSVQTVSLKPVADTYVSAAAPTQNFGQQPVLAANRSPLVQSFVRFNVPAGIGTVQRATLRVFANKPHPTGFLVRPVTNNSWSESQTTATNAPAVGAAVVAQSGTLSTGSWIEVDVTSIVAGTGPVSLALVTTGTPNVEVASRENSPFAPQLIVETAAPTNPTPTPSPTATPSPTSTPSPTATPGSPTDPTCASGQYRAEYFNNMTLSGSPVLVRCESAIDYDWAKGSPARGVNKNGFSVRWSASLQLSDGSYAFTTTADDGVRVFLNGAIVINEWKPQPVTALTANANVEAGANTIVVEYFEDRLDAVAKFSMQPSQAPPPSPTPSPTPTPTEPDPSPSPFPGTGPNAVAPGTMNLTSTFNNVGIELFFSGDDNKNAVANLEFRRSGDGNWHQGLPLWGTYSDQAPGRAFYGSALLLDAGVTYDIQINMYDPDGVNGSFTIIGSVSTRADNIPAASSLTPTHYVSPSGNDSNSGTSANSAWRTLEKAFTAAPSGAVVRFAAGSYAPPTSKRTSPITLVGNGAVIEPQTVIAAGAWESVTLTGPATGAAYTVWHAVAPIEGVNRLAFEHGGSAPEVVATWKLINGDAPPYTMSTPEGWAEVLYLNDMYNYGFASFGNDVYVRLPNDVNPNDAPARVHRKAGYYDGRMVLDAPDSRVTGFTIKMTTLQLDPRSDGSVIDHNQFLNADVYLFGDDQATPQDFAEDVLIEYNTMTHTSLYDPALNHEAIGWKWVKGPMYIDGVKSGWNRVGDTHELTAIGGQGGGRRVVIRHNTIEGYFNGIGAGMNLYDSAAGKREYDIHDNTIRYIADDVFELDNGAVNWRVWDNRVSYSSVQVSTGPANRGPAYIFRNTFAPMTNDGVGMDKTGDTTVKVLGFKYSGDSNPPMLLYVVNNTFWSADSDASGGNNAAGGAGSPEHFYMRNNIFVMHRYVFAAKEGAWDEDYNAFTTSDLERGLEWNGKDRGTLDAYRIVSGQGTHSNPQGGFHDPIDLDDPAHGDVSLPGGSPLIDAGVVVPNITETYDGNAPDIGAIEN